MFFAFLAECVNARGLKPKDPKLNPCFCAYDILYLNGESLLDKPYGERVRRLRTVFEDHPGNMVLCPRTKVRNTEHILQCLNNAIDDNEEGVVIKRADSVYQPGKRDRGGWFKIKPDVCPSHSALCIFAFCHVVLIVVR